MTASDGGGSNSELVHSKLVRLRWHHDTSRNFNIYGPSVSSILIDDGPSFPAPPLSGARCHVLVLSLPMGILTLMKACG